MGGLSPLHEDDSYPAYGNKNMAGSMVDINLFQPNYLHQGFTDAQLTNGGLSGVVSNAITGITPNTDYLGNAYAVGGTKLYQLSSDATEVTSNGSWPHTINKSVVTGESAYSVINFGVATYYVYNHSGPAADIGLWNQTSFDDDWGSTVPTGAATLFSNDALTTYHPLCVGLNDVLYIGNAGASTVGSFDGTTLITSALDLPTLSDVTSIDWFNDKLYIFVNNPRNVTGSQYRYRSSCFIWDGTTNSWETEIPINGRVGGSIVLNGVLLFFYRHYGYGNYRLAYINGSQIVDISSFDGSAGPPTKEKITESNGYIIWYDGKGSGRLYAYGSGHPDLPARLFQFGSSTYDTTTAISAPTGYVMVASNNSTNYRLGSIDITKTSSNAFSTAASYKTLLYDVSGETGLSRLNSLVFNFEKLTSGARVDWSLVNNQGKTIYSDTISYTKLGAVTQCVYELNGLLTENFRIELSYANGSTSSTVKVKNIKVYGNSNQ